MNESVYRVSPRAYPLGGLFSPRPIGARNFMIFAFTSPVFAALYTGNKIAGLGFTFMRGDNGKPIAVERYPGAFEAKYKFSGYIYELSGRPFRVSDNHDRWKVASYHPAEVLDIKYVPDFRKHLTDLKSKGELDLYFNNEKPRFVSEDDSDLVNKAVEMILRKRRENLLWDLRGVQPHIFERVFSIVKSKGIPGLFS